MTLGQAIYCGLGHLTIELQRCQAISDYERDEYYLQGRGSPLPEAMSAAMELLAEGPPPAPPANWEEAEYLCALAHNGRVLEISARLIRDKLLYTWEVPLTRDFATAARHAAGRAKVWRPGTGHAEGAWVC